MALPEVEEWTVALEPAWLGVIALLLSACLGCPSREGPPREAPVASLTLSAIPVAMDGRAIPLEVSWRTSSDQLRPVVEPRIVSVEPPDLANVYESKELRCRRNGNGVVRIQVADQVASTPLRCLPAFQLGQARQYPFRLVLGSPPEPSGISALRSGGAIDESVAVTVTSDAPDVLSVDGNLLVPKKLGRAQITGTAEGLRAKTWTFEVVKRLGFWRIQKPFEPISIELDPGRYELAFKNTQDELLIVKWSGFPRCNYSGKATWPVITCSPDRPTRMNAYPPKKEWPMVDYLELVELPP